MSDPVNARAIAIATANSRRPRQFERVAAASGRDIGTSGYFGRNTFSLAVMAAKLPKPVFKRVKACVRGGAALSREDADVVAHGAKEWALENGASHFTHWFQPMTGNTAEKHDAFLTFNSEGMPVERFTGDMLIQSEPDASSFPSGGMRSTFEARGYTAWDPSSPMFLRDTENGSTLCIPSAFISYTGEALDQKTPLLRSMEAINRSAGKLLTAIGEEPHRVTPSLGCEQEYFLVDRAYWALRPDLAIGGRTVVGANPPKGQSLDDHYFGSITPRVLSFMQEVEQELYLLGVPAKTRHNEVAPGQFELAPIFAEANVGVDHNQLIQEVLERVAMRHEFKVLLHEKPFANINGSGKHNNWSLSCDGENLLEPGDAPKDNVRFLAVLAAVLLGVHRYGGVLRASIATHGNDFRLGANEAPPAIMSVFLGEVLTDICDTLAGGAVPTDDADQAMLELGVSKLPDVAKDNTDRNRTSPMAFTGNKFEFRAVGSDQNPSWPVTVMNTIVASGMDQLTEWVAQDGSALKAIQRAMKETSAVRFEGDGYSADWVEEASRRGLKNLRTTPEALAELRLDSAIKLFADHGVLSAPELESRYNVQIEQYVTAVDIEIDALRLIVDELILPVAISEQGMAADALGKLLAVAGKGISVSTSAAESRLAGISAALDALHTDSRALGAAMAEARAADDEASAYARLVRPAMDNVRAAVDALEGLVSDGAWPLPKYREMLFLV